MPVIYLLHGYSRRNRGDGLLVDLSRKLIIDASANDEDRMCLVAADAMSFNDLSRVIQVRGTSGSLLAKILDTLKVVSGMVLDAVLDRVRYAPLDADSEPARFIVGVGGGYLRAGNPLEALKTLVVHYPQLRWAAAQPGPSVYLPQSIGPLCGPVGMLVRRALAGIDLVCIRDDRSGEQLSGLQNLRRLPDLAVLELGDALSGLVLANRFERVYLVVRDLAKPPKARADYIRRLKALKSLVPEVEVVLQSTGRGNDDAAFCRREGFGSGLRGLEQAAVDSGPGIVVSVRLHGALQGLLSACPAIHLSYERKGFGAFQDMGLEKYVHSYSRFDPEAVASQIAELKEDSRDYWQALREAAPRIQKHRDELVAAVGSLWRRGDFPQQR